MAELHEILAERVAGWRASGYAHDAHPAIAEILHFARHEDGVPRYLREPQIRALETYWYLRLEEGTARIENLYLGLFQGREVLQALGIGGEEMPAPPSMRGARSSSSTASRPMTTSSGIMLGEEVLVALNRGGATD